MLGSATATRGRIHRARRQSRSGRSNACCSYYGNCVEVACNLPGLVAVRDSEKPGGAKLVISRETWQVFLKGLRR
jgi:hypothetical protein